MHSKPSEICLDCEFWNVWRKVALVDDEPKRLGHCVIKTYPHMEIIQGLTAEDFSCSEFSEREQE